MSDPNTTQLDSTNSNNRQQYGQGQPGPENDPRAEFLNYRFSQEELQVIAECESEAFYNRSLPLSLALGAGSYLGVKNGIFKAHSSLGPWPKVITFSIIGYIAGRISYNKKCQEKMMALPNSRFAEMLRRNLNRKTNQWDVGRQEAGAATALSLAPFQSATSSNSDHLNQPNSLNLDTSRPHYSSLDDTYTPTMEGTNDLNEDLAIPTRKSTVTYDELRQKNRDDYAKTHTGTYYNQWQFAPAPPEQQQQPASPTDVPAGSYSSLLDGDRRRGGRIRGGDNSDGVSQGGPKNKYGDTWSE